jgi:catechol 2,3-dioxygenase-like lactoylglutathione lyase family enzyme
MPQPANDGQTPGSPAALPIRGLHHIARATRRPEESKAFYCEVLGFRELPRPKFSFRGAWLYNYGMQIHLIENPEVAPRPGGPIDSRLDHMAFAVDDLDAAKESLEARGIAFQERVNAGGVRQIFFHDPDGHHIELAVYGDPAVGFVRQEDAR